MQFEINDPNVVLTLNDAIRTRQVSSQVRTLQWQRGLEYVYAATDTEVHNYNTLIFRLNYSLLDT